MSGGFLSSNSIEDYHVDNDNIGWSPPQASPRHGGQESYSIFSKVIHRGGVPSGAATFIAVVKDG
jgi:hypothetical protein